MDNLKLLVTQMALDKRCVARPKRKELNDLQMRVLSALNRMQKEQNWMFSKPVVYFREENWLGIHISQKKPLVALNKNDVGSVEKLSLRKQRFMLFSSLEHEGEYYMTPRDFLFSVMFEQVERKTQVKKLARKDIEDVLSGIKTARCGSTFFRDLGDKGLISYTEYLFLLTILTSKYTASLYNSYVEFSFLTSRT
uniref:calcium uptake protein 2, mitochondrial-like n=1 Tax=Myodes glareolus TaxID=447135 RepID=UPI00202129B1|nr:calcium uptake protein 2, mitochondrial-like [Myodes glareolus]